MAMTWIPDFCPDNPGCRLTVARDWSRASFINICQHHQDIKATNAFTDAQLFRSLLANSRRKEAARAAAKRELALDKEHPGVPYRVDADGGFTIGVDQRGEIMPEWPANRTRLIAAIDDAVLRSETGTSQVRTA